MAQHTRFVLSLRTVRFAVVLGTVALIVPGESTLSAQRPAPRLVLTHGVASGDVTASSAVIWARSSGPARVHVEVDTNPAFRHAKSRTSVRTSEATDFTAHLRLEGLKPGTRYWYRVWLTPAGGRERSRVSDSSEVRDREREEDLEQDSNEDVDRPTRTGALVGTFRTAPARWQSRPVSFVVGADVGGQRFCRNAAEGGYTIFARMTELRPDFFVANGDLIYADGDCPADGPDGPGGWQNIPGDFPNVSDPSVDWTNAREVREIYLRHYRYNRGDPFLQSFLQTTPMIAQWDDHEVINDFGAPWTYWNSANVNRAGYQNLVSAGRDTFFAYSPNERDAADSNRIYRSFRWGKDVELFVLDARSYRDRNDLPDTPANDKVMLGKTQLAWLVEGIRRSTATWKIVSSDVPISIPTGSVAFGRDAWANLGAEPTGFERELLRLLAELDRINAKNIVFVTTDVHFAQTISYEIDADHDGDMLRFHELVSGPLNAVRLTPRALDPAANPLSLYVEGGMFNFTYVRIGKQADGNVHLIADVRGANGEQRPGSLLDLTPE